MFTIVKRYYNRGIYDDNDVATFVKAGRLTKDEYKEITGQDYKAV